MFESRIRMAGLAVLTALTMASCAHPTFSGWGEPACDEGCTPGCGTPDGCYGQDGYYGHGGCISPVGCITPCGLGMCGRPCWLFRRRCFSIPDTLPLGSTVRAHYHTMQTNAEATDFVLNHYDFVESTAELTPAGRDRIVEIAARAKSAPFPVVVERSENNSDPELDALRRNLVAQVLTDFGVPEANARTFVSPAYGRHANTIETQFDYYQLIYSRGYGQGGVGAGGYGAGGFGAAGGGGFGGGYGF